MLGRERTGGASSFGHVKAPGLENGRTRADFGRYSCQSTPTSHVLPGAGSKYRWLPSLTMTEPT